MKIDGIEVEVGTRVMVREVDWPLSLRIIRPRRLQCWVMNRMPRKWVDRWVKAHWARVGPNGIYTVTQAGWER